jgi:hypothetical protein
VGLLSNYLCRYLRCIVHMCVCVCVISELQSVKGQSNFPVHSQEERFCVINKRHRRLFAWRHLEAGQYVAQSGLQHNQSEPHSWKENKKNICQDLSGGFTISLSSTSIDFNKIYCGNHYRYNNICRRQESKLSDLKEFHYKKENESLLQS